MGVLMAAPDVLDRKVSNGKTALEMSFWCDHFDGPGLTPREAAAIARIRLEVKRWAAADAVVDMVAKTLFAGIPLDPTAPASQDL